MDKVSIIIPIYNCEEYLSECLDSVLNQTYKNIEVLMINDGTKDKSNIICRKYAKKYNWIFIDRKQNKGLSYTRNEGLDNATGKYVMFLDSDDILYKDAIKTLYDEIKSQQSDIVISKINSFNSSGNYGYYSDKYLDKEETTNIFKNKKLINCISVCAKLYDKKIINGVRFISGIYHEDNYFTLKILTKAKKISILPKYTYYRRIREGENISIMQNLNRNTFNDLLLNFKQFAIEIPKNEKIDFIYNFMYRKSINYIIMNINNIDEYKESIDICKKFRKYTYEYRNLSFIKKELIEIKYTFYFLFARGYKILKKLKK